MAKKSNLKMTPIMALAVFAIFAMMIPLFSMANTQNRATTSRAAQATPEPTPDMWDKMDKK